MNGLSRVASHPSRVVVLDCLRISVRLSVGAPSKRGDSSPRQACPRAQATAMPLHLQHHKSYHPYNRENIERVRRDEELAKAQEQEAEQQSLVADSEARIELLRQKRAEAVAGSDRDGRLKAAERELDGKTGSLERFDEAQRAKIGAQDIDSAKRNHSGHINFWADLEQVSPPRPPWRALQHTDGF